ncbi:MAG: hypothetical protein SO401_09345 [Blautia sp.]|nr:hypothetical protein [Blautia sp.]
MDNTDYENLGYVEYGGKPYTYYFNPEDFRLTLIPKAYDRQAYFDAFKDFGKKPDRDDWIRSNTVIGTPLGKTSGMIFSLLDNPSTFNGIPQYPVNWYAKLPDDADADSVVGIEIVGGDVNRFYSPNHVLERELTADSFTVKTGNQVNAKCGTFILDDGNQCKVSVSAYGSFNVNSYDSPLSATSRMKLKFSTPVKLEEAVRIYYGSVLSFFQFINYRRNIAFEKVQLIWKTPLPDHPDYRSYGELHFPPAGYPADIEKKQDMRIRYELTGEHTAGLISHFHNGRANLEFLTDTAAKRSSYPPSRIMEICTEFEREFHNAYGTDALRHEEYRQVKDEVAGWIEEKAKDYSGKKRQYLKSFSRSITNLDDSYGQRVEYALKENEEIVKPFIDAAYKNGFSELKDGIPERCNDIRNGFMHSRLDLELEPVNISDINILEILIYVIVLKQYIEADKVKDAVNDLFGYHLRFEKDGNGGE